MSSVSSSKIFKTSVNLSESTLQTLEALASKRGKSMSQVIRDAIETEKLLQETSDQGGKILIKDKDETMKQLILR
jgi:predicted DNA-binding protein